MLLFRTILLWLSFSLLILQYFIDVHEVIPGFIFRLLPSGLLLLWFLLTVLVREKIKIQQHQSKFLVNLFHIMRPLASISIVLGAILKIMHWPYGNPLLIAGIGFMAIYSTILCKIAIPKDDYNPDVLDDMDE